MIIMRLSLLALIVSFLSVAVGFAMVLVVLAKYVVPSAKLQRVFQTDCEITDIANETLSLPCPGDVFSDNSTTVVTSSDVNGTCWINCVTVSVKFDLRGSELKELQKLGTHIGRKTGYLVLKQSGLYSSEFTQYERSPGQQVILMCIARHLSAIVRCTKCFLLSAAPCVLDVGLRQYLKVITLSCLI